MPVTQADAEHVRRAFAVFNERFEDLRGEALADYRVDDPPALAALLADLADALGA